MTDGDEEVRQAIRSRYQHAYWVADRIVKSGDAVRVLGVLVGIVITMAGAVLAYQLRTGMAVVLAAGLGLLLSSSVYMFGIVVSAQGEVLFASLDSAVSSSPFLTDEDRVIAMDL